ncbi:MAG: histidine--tRNA ligase, partial [Syntrophobacteraceae bacterium]|nr:histidine--tRNA ligase [Syntrophobacteraceae bacterium]
MSFGADRIYDVLDALGKFPDELNVSAKVFLVNFGVNEEKFCIKLLRELHSAGISAELFPESGAKMKKQMSYADAKKFPFVIMAGENEINAGKLILKNMATGQQQELSM